MISLPAIVSRVLNLGVIRLLRSKRETIYRSKRTSQEGMSGANEVLEGLEVDFIPGEYNLSLRNDM